MLPVNSRSYSNLSHSSIGRLANLIANADDLGRDEEINVGVRLIKKTVPFITLITEHQGKGRE